MQDNGLTQQILSRLDAIGAKLGVAAQAVWGFYIRQAYVEGITCLLIGLLALALCIAGSCLLPRMWNWDFGIMEDGYRKKNSHTEGPAYFFYCIGLVTFGGVAVTYLYNSVTPLLNPGYWAFQQLVSNMK